MGKRVVIVDTSNEIGGDGDVPHPAIGSARRMQVRGGGLGQGAGPILGRGRSCVCAGGDNVQRQKSSRHFLIMIHVPAILYPPGA